MKITESELVEALAAAGPSLGPPRKTHCKRGHPFSAENTYVRLAKKRNAFERICRTCERARDWKRRGYTGQGNKPKTHCPHGHPYSGNNLRINKYGQRRCIVCARRHSAESRHRALERVCT